MFFLEVLPDSRILDLHCFKEQIIESCIPMTLLEFSAYVALDISLLYFLFFIKFLFSASNPEFELNPTIILINFQGYQRKSLLICPSGQIIYLFFV